MDKQESSILFLGKEDDWHVNKALEFCQLNFTDVVASVGKWGDPLPESIHSWQGDYIISYLSRWIVPKHLLERACVAAINFHPAPPEYPGIGCNNFALYEEAKEYGVTCHHMAPSVDTGKIIAVKRFPLLASDTVSTLLSRTYDYQQILFYEILNHIFKGEKIPTSEEQWTRKPFSRKEFNKLSKIELDMPKEEISKRVRATNFGIWKPTLEIQGFTFELKN
ncbi:formyltransferase family protein [Leptothoe spongobia]|uniref:phosphoribosylglycinamide formyltransferase 1 n=1 Tax=Leptothoe spongobia TAU-MAC 1115 TaxID=1967444 RepID=A0A947DEN8_9CYAN|nr:formyltransferase family protein [Leptothoe spongobia]MBT9315653.1 hypothetical protein [Leptothoe spongobia TAU-MAC 1115]